LPDFQFSLGFYFFIDACTYSKSPLNGSDPPVHINFVDWIPGICSALGMLVINSIDKARLSGDSFSYSGNGVAWKARLVLFLGFALLAGGLAGSVVRSWASMISRSHGADGFIQTVMVLKYVVPSYPFPTLWFGVANVLANALIMLRYVTSPPHDPQISFWFQLCCALDLAKHGRRIYLQPSIVNGMVRGRTGRKGLYSFTWTWRWRSRQHCILSPNP
jgi:hypothetical protein